MEALLLLGGAVLLTLGWLWLVIAAVRLSVGRMLLALLFAPLTLVLRGLGYPLWPRLLLLFGLCAAIAGAALLQVNHPERMQALLSGRWAVEPEAASDLRGTIMGQPFVPNRIFWRGEDLVFEEGPADRVRRSLTIRFANARELLLAPVIERLPEDQGAWPELILRWHTGALSEPGLRRVSGDYSLSLDFAQPVAGRVEGRIHLHLPTIHSTWLTGQVVLSSTPEWLLERERARRVVLYSRTSEPAVAAPAEAPPVPPQWRELSLLALMDEPQLFSGAAVRLTTWSGRTHLGSFKELSAEQRLILSQERGPHQVELHFHPLDIRRIEERAR
ncbi:hypothetical protein [Pseudomonas sp. MYb185]|uniref:hypothetical protein n=1 Tax=Pseudomonas sp. MYb185 TaxID=1848729 RepID=UPI000CFB785B|nr:hypothetical protein [Pseudomonas sp. MYb185]PRB82049.1 hypothetical protein CQ007_07745 [Pseudomonas sp. MYb185]